MATGSCEPPGWAGPDYAAESHHHRAFDDWFLAAHPPAPDDDVVDAGCGTGEFTASLADLVPNGTVVGIDADPSMLEVARRHDRPNLAFRQATLSQLDEVCGASSADLVVSRAVFHWIPLDDHLACYEAVRRVLRPGGWFHAESGGSGNVARLRQVLGDVAGHLGLTGASVSLPDAGTVLELLEQAGFELPPSAVTTVAQRRAFDRSSLLGLVRTQAAVAYGLTPSSDQLEAFVRLTAERLEGLRRHDGSFDQTFVRLDVLCRRPS